MTVQSPPPGAIIPAEIQIGDHPASWSGWSTDDPSHLPGTERHEALPAV